MWGEEGDRWPRVVVGTGVGLRGAEEPVKWRERERVMSPCRGINQERRGTME